MTAQYFKYDGISSEVYNLVIGSFSGSDDGTQEMGNVDITTVKAPHSNKFLKANATYNSPLVITFSLIKMNCNDWNDYIFTQRDIGFISRWLARKDYKQLKFYQNGWENIHYNAIMKVNQHMVGGECVGFDITATCDAPWGYDQMQTTELDTVLDNKHYFRVHDDSDEIGEIYPKVEIIPKQNGTIEITNQFTGKTTKIRNCVAGEKITISNFAITSDQCRPDDSGATYDYKGSHPTLYNDFNWVWPTIGNYFTPQNIEDSRINEFDITGECNIKMYWESPRKAVV